MPTTVDNGAPKSLLDRAFTMLGSFGPHDRTLSLNDLCERTLLPRSTVHRLALTMVRWRVLERDGAGFRLGMRLFELGELVSPSRELRELALPFMQDVYEATHETVNLAVLDGADVVYLAKIRGHRKGTAASRTGGRLPAYCTALGKVLLAHADAALVERTIKEGLKPRTPYTIVVPQLLLDQLDEVRRKGVALDLEESANGIVCAAAPVRQRSRRVIAAMSVSASTGRYTADQLVPLIKTATFGLSRALGAH